MFKRKLQKRLTGAASIAVAAVAASMTLGATGASAFTIPPLPTNGVYPNWYNGNVEGIRDAGSDTTFYIMQTLGDMYTAAGLYGCALNSPSEATCNASTNTNIPTTDTGDNYDRTEVTEGVDDVGSGAGQNQLCGVLSSPLPLDFSRSSKPPGSISGCNMVGTGYAKDGVPAIDFPTVNPGAIGAVVPTNLPWSAAAQSSANEAANGGQALVGSLANGWLPGDPVNCTPNTGDVSPKPAGDCSGYPFTNVDNGGGSGGASSLAYRIWCATDSTRITDWGQLTNLSAANNGGTAQTVGNGAPIGIPVEVVALNTGSGTAATFASYAQSGDASGNCNGTNVTDINGEVDPNPATAPSPNTAPQALENNASQVSSFADSWFPNDPADQAVDIDASLYYMSNGVYNTNSYADTETLAPGTGSLNGAPSAYIGNEMTENGVQVSILAELGNTYPTARTLFNIFTTNTLRGSTAGFVNWLCDSQNAIQKEVDHDTGVTFDQEITNVIQNQYGFSRLTDLTSEVSNSKIEAKDNLMAPNSSCAASTAGMTTSGTSPTANVQSGSTTVTLSSGNWPAAITVGTKVINPVAGGTSVIPSGDTVSAVSGNTLTLTTAATGTNATATLEFPGVAPATVVANPNS